MGDGFAVRQDDDQELGSPIVIMNLFKGLVSMTTEEIEDIYTALWMRRNFIETGSASLSASDAVASDQHKLIKSLEPSQKRTIARLEGLMEKFLRSKR